MRGRLLRYSCLYLLLNCIVLESSAQVQLHFIEYGTTTQEELIGVTVRQLDGTFTGVSSDKLGVLIPQGQTIGQFECKYLGYQDTIITLDGKAFEDFYVELIPAQTQLETVEIVGRNQSNKDLLPQTIQVINRVDIQRQVKQSSADILTNSGSVFVQKSQMGGGSPVMRGFEANKLLLVVDGVRLNNLIYRGGHLQNAITVDHGSLENMELIFGPGSLTYGSDALGGVIHFKTLDPKFNSKDELTLGHQYVSANQGHRLGASLTFGKEKFASATSVSFGSYGDLKVGGRRPSIYADFPNFGLTESYYSEDGDLLQNTNPLIQKSTGYTQFDLLQKFKFKLSKDMDLTFNAQMSTSTDIPRYDQLTLLLADGTPEFKQWYYGPQNRLLLSPTLAINRQTRLFDKALVIASFQDVEESRIRQFSDSETIRTQTEQVNVYGLTVDFAKTLTDQVHLDYGIDIHYNTLNSSVANNNPDGVITDLTRYPDGDNSLTQGGIYAQLNYYTLSEKWRFTLGGRGSGQSVKMGYVSDEVIVWPDYFYDGFANTTSSFVASGSATYNLGKVKLKYGVGQGFRAPNIDDLAKVRVKSDEITVPNPDLTPEKTFNQELSILFSDKMTSLEIVGFYTLIDDAIVRDDFTLPNGSTFYTDGDGNSYAITGNQNAESGYIYGTGIALEQQSANGLSMVARLNYTVGRSVSNDITTPLGHIPPLFGMLGVNFTKNNLDLGADYRFNEVKDIADYGGSVDNPEYALPSGSPAFGIFGLNAQYRYKKLTAVVSLENVLDTFYRPFASGVSGSGRSVNVSMNFRI